MVSISAGVPFRSMARSRHLKCRRTRPAAAAGASQCLSPDGAAGGTIGCLPEDPSPPEGIAIAARMNDAEAIMWVVESDPFLRTDFTNVTVLEAAPDLRRLRAGLERAIEAFPPLRQRVARPPLGLAPPQWADDPDFDLGYHLRSLSLPPPGGQRQLLDLAAQLAAMPLDRARPLWELTVVEGLAGGRAAGLPRRHHALADGVGGMKLLRSLLERTPPPDDERARPAAPAAPPDPLIWR